MALVRVYLFCYRRPHTLRRAIDSLLAQTLTDWVCEAHNDDPNDTFPKAVIESLNDARFEYRHHRRNLGAVATFNFAWAKTDEPFMSILEDDNWWEPRFLETLHAHLVRRSEVNLAWTNQRLWQELPGDRWIDKGLVNVGGSVAVYRGAVPRCVLEPLHAQGAMLVRNGPWMKEHPATLPLFIIETARERNVPGPILYVDAPLANFATTLTTARRESQAEKLGAETLSARQFIEAVPAPPSFFQQAFARTWWSGRGAKRAILLGALLAGRLDVAAALRPWRELALCLIWTLLHPATTAGALKFVLRNDALTEYTTPKWRTEIRDPELMTR